MNDSAKINNNKLPEWQFVLMMLITVIVWALAFPLIKTGLDEGLHFINLTIMRFFVVCVVLIPILLLNFKKFSKLHKKDIPLILF